MRERSEWTRKYKNNIKGRIGGESVIENAGDRKREEFKEGRSI